MNKSFAKVLNGIREIGKIRLSHTAKLGIAGTALFVAGCGQQDTGDVIGVQGRRVWFHPQPYGMVYVPSGTFHTGQADQDIFSSYIQPNKQVTITAFWMDETEITNNEYRQFVHFVIDSIARYMVDDDALFVEDEDGNRAINYDVELDWEKFREELEDMYYRESERFRGKKQIDTRKLYYVYQWYDMVMAANLDRDKYAPMDRAKFIKKEKTLIYPDTLAFVRDFTYSFNEPQARHYFHHVKFDDYPVVGVNWHQAVAFSNWRTIYKNNYWESLGLPVTEDFRLPTEYEWEYAARGGRIGNKYPWGGPYTRNEKGCMLANFKPLRGNYGADGGVYPVRVDSYFPNDFGLYNMSGNVSEWTSTTYEIGNNMITHDLNAEYYTRIPEYGPEAARTPISLKRKVIRGGSWKDVAYFIENGARTFEYQDTSKSYVGFRCVQSYLGRSNRDKK